MSGADDEPDQPKMKKPGTTGDWHKDFGPDRWEPRPTAPEGRPLLYGRSYTGPEGAAVPWPDYVWEVWRHWVFESAAVPGSEIDWDAQDGVQLAYLLKALRITPETMASGLGFFMRSRLTHRFEVWDAVAIRQGADWNLHLLGEQLSCTLTKLNAPLAEIRDRGVALLNSLPQSKDPKSFPTSEGEQRGLKASSWRRSLAEQQRGGK